MLSNTIGWRTAVFTSLALVAFAANSLFNRAAFAASGIDAGSFVVIRLASGALALALISWTQGALRASLRGGSWQAGAMLFAYAAAFSYAYISLSVGTGALILFAAVQITMLLAALRLGEKVTTRQWAGLALAFAGLGVLLFPGLTAPSPGAAALMATAGVAWGIYSLLGRQSASPLSDTAANFMRSLPFAAVLDPRQLQRFKNEAQAAASLHHTNILPVYSVGCERGVHYYAMQFVDGPTLADVIAELRGVQRSEFRVQRAGNRLKATKTGA